MKNILAETNNLYNKVFSRKQHIQIKDITKQIKSCYDKYPTKYLWEVDKEIGGIGGYSMPQNPIFNPYPGGEYRKLFRPLQYVRSDIELCNIHLNARYVVVHSGMHLEEILRIILSKTNLLGSIRFHNTTLGKATRILDEKRIVNKDIIEGLYGFVKLYNKAKHDINMDKDRERLFTAEDALICYLASRVIGVKLLKFIGHESIKFKYEIDYAHNNNLIEYYI